MSLTSVQTPDNQDIQANQANQASGFDKLWLTLATQDLYRLDIKIDVGMRQSVPLDGEDLELAPEVVAALSGGYRKQVSAKLKAARTKLSTLQKALYRDHSVYGGGFRFVTAEALPLALDEIADMNKIADDLRQELIDGYDAERDLFEQTLEETLNQAIADSPTKSADIRHYMVKYLDKFPAKTDFDECLSVVVNGPHRLANLADHLKQDAQFQEQAKLSAADAAEQARLKAQADLQTRAAKVMLSNLDNAISAAQGSATDEAASALAKMFDRVDARDGDVFNDRDIQALESVAQRFKVLASVNPQLDALADAIKPLVKTIRTGDIMEIADHTDDFREMVTSAIADLGNGEGVAELAQSLATQDRFAEISLDIDQVMMSDMDEETKAARLAEIESKFDFTSQVNALRASKLRKRLNKALKGGSDVPTVEPVEELPIEETNEVLPFEPIEDEPIDEPVEELPIEDEPVKDGSDDNFDMGAFRAAFDENTPEPIEESPAPETAETLTPEEVFRKNNPF